MINKSTEMKRAIKPKHSKVSQKSPRIMSPSTPIHPQQKITHKDSKNREPLHKKLSDQARRHYSKQLLIKHKSPPKLKRQNTDYSPEINKPSQKMQGRRKKKEWKGSDCAEEELMESIRLFAEMDRADLHKNKSREIRKVQSDEESTDAFHQYRDSAEEEQSDPYRIATSKDTEMQNSNPQSVDRNECSLSIRCRRSKKNRRKDFKESLQFELKSYKSLESLHERESQYYQGALNPAQSRRLNKMQCVERQRVRLSIFSLKKKLDDQLSRGSSQKVYRKKT